MSRVPRTFDSESLRQCLEKALGDGGSAAGGEDIIEKAEVIWDEDEGCNKGWGFAVFFDPAQRSAAVKRGVVKVKKHRMHLQEVERHREGRGRDGGICYLWQQGTCTHGNFCRFAHTGEGGCASTVVLTPEELEKRNTLKKKKIKCFAFRKGKCKLGDKCPYSHDFDPKAVKKKKKDKNADVTGFESNDMSSSKGSDQKPCFNWQKKGKCRKGDSCPYLHETAEEMKARERHKKDRKGPSQNKKRKRQEASVSTKSWSSIRPGDSYDAEPGQVRVFGLPYSTTEEDIRTFFSSCPGTIETLDMPLWEDSGRSKGFCGLKFSSEEGVKAALVLDGKELGGRWLRIQRGKMFSSWGVGNGNNQSLESGDTGKSNKRNKYEDTPSGDTSTGAADGASISKNTRTVFLGNLDWTLSKRALRRACEEAYGKVSSVRLQKPTKEQQEQHLHRQQQAKDSTTSKEAAEAPKKSNNSGFAHVTFATEEIAKKAVKMNGEMFLGRVSRVDFAYNK